MVSRTAPASGQQEGGISPDDPAIRAKMLQVEFSALYFDEMPQLVRFVMKHGASLVEATDAAQAAFAAAWEVWEQIHEPRAWLRKVAVREYLRRPATEISVEDAPDSATPLSAIDAAELGEQEQVVLGALGSLPMKQRQVMAWCYDGFTHNEIAEQMRITEEAVRQNLHRARERLKALLLEAQTEGGVA